jgi:hypothetical protein
LIREGITEALTLTSSGALIPPTPNFAARLRA